jgi:hypothetical protein
MRTARYAVALAAVALAAVALVLRAAVALAAMAELPEAIRHNIIITREQDDPQFVRTVYFVRECPCAEECSVQAWNRCAHWSYEGHEAVLEMVAKHLISSGKHMKTSEEAEKLAGEAIVHEEDETYAERETYRRQLERQDEIKRERSMLRPPSSPPPDAKRATRRAPHLADSVDVVRILKPPASERLRLQKAHKPDDVVFLRVSEAKIILDSIERAKASAEQMKRLSMRAAGEFESKAAAMHAVANQFSEEGRVMAVAGDVLNDYIASSIAAAGEATTLA